MEAEGVPVQLSSWIHKGKNLSVLERRNRMGYARLFCVSRHLHRKTLSLSRSPSLPVLIFLPGTHPKTSYRRLPRGTLARQRDPVCHLIKRPTQTDGFVQTAPDALKAGTGSPPRQIRRRNAHLPLRWKPNRRKHINIELHHCWCETVRLWEK